MGQINYSISLQGYPEYHTGTSLELQKTILSAALKCHATIKMKEAILQAQGRIFIV